jgi:adenosylmethionine-8-amino-7-oxononanoate aminotransferase
MSGILSALHYLKVLDDERVYKQYDSVKETAIKIFDKLKELPSVKNVRNYGLTWCIDLNIENMTNDYLIDLFFKNGLYLGLLNSPAETKRILIHIPSMEDTNYFNLVNSRLTTVLKSL